MCAVHGQNAASLFDKPLKFQNKRNKNTTIVHINGQYFLSIYRIFLMFIFYLFCSLFDFVVYVWYANFSVQLPKIFYSTNNISDVIKFFFFCSVRLKLILKSGVYLFGEWPNCDVVNDINTRKTKQTHTKRMRKRFREFHHIDKHVKMLVQREHYERDFLFSTRDSTQRWNYFKWDWKKKMLNK